MTLRLGATNPRRLAQIAVADGGVAEGGGKQFRWGQHLYATRIAGFAAIPRKDKAEGMGFEPTTPFGAPHFQCGRWPIRLPSEVAPVLYRSGDRDSFNGSADRPGDR